MQLIVRHKVTDFIRWREIFESHREAQREAGMKLKKLWQNVDDPEEVVLYFDVDDEERAREFVFSNKGPDIKDGTEVIDDPDVYFVE
ncbi:hypothetical protein NC796_07060 [Aliifodinibius sp. S!AR15-10]|uniref:hypothetical protein n=1 Tax=Aliifodinibius sp. S!AR15-10 TaxID=2950437 RepID=UPI00285BB857|nr:hypothetical protein [Aliifodinibius sp. S!AR15-10]MDR8390889.1 hypothetical protein [Aliifodinibius sp. S!AR15-10]